MVWDDVCQSGQHVVYSDRTAWDGVIDEDENGSYRADVFLDLSCNTLLANLVLLRVASVWRGVEGANVENTFYVVTTLTRSTTISLLVVSS